MHEARFVLCRVLAELSRSAREVVAQVGHGGFEQVGEWGGLVGEPCLVRGQGEGEGDLADGLGEEVVGAPVGALGDVLGDDLAYGAGLWLGTLRSRTVRCLTPRLVRRPQESAHAPGSNV